VATLRVELTAVHDMRRRYNAFIAPAMLDRAAERMDTILSR
jgi:hypothetical protein